MTDLRYPIGTFSPPERVTPESRASLLKELADLPERLAGVVHHVTGELWGRRYREGGWTVRQLVHHIADSHVNGYVRIKLALTESQPLIKTYEEARWAELPDVGAVDPAVSLTLLRAVHDRWVTTLRMLPLDEWEAYYLHPDGNRLLSLDYALAHYAWHGQHHLAHIGLALGGH